jgi:hypothetical protein
MKITTLALALCSLFANSVPPTSLQTKVLIIPPTYAHAYDVSAPALRGFNSALGTLVAVHFDLTTGPINNIQFENHDTLSPCILYLGYEYDYNHNTYVEHPAVNTLDLYYILEPPFGDGTEFFLGKVSNTMASEIHTLQVFDGTTDFDGDSGYTWTPDESTTTQDLSVLTDPASLAYFTGKDRRIYLQLRALQDVQIWNAGSNLYQIDHGNFSGIIRVTFEYIPR